jgi:hypothetical protein
VGPSFGEWNRYQAMTKKRMPESESFENAKIFLFHFWVILYTNFITSKNLIP